jgi:hypothetical protein
MVDFPQIDYNKLAEKLREELDVHSAFTLEKFIREGLDAHFNARICPMGGVDLAVKVSDYWKKTDTGGEIRCPAGMFGVGIYSKNSFNLASFKTKLPTLTKDGQHVWMGFEDGGGCGTGIAAFDFGRDVLGEHLRAYACGQFAWSSVVIDAALPSNAKTVEHVYGVAILKPWAEFYIDGVPVAYGLNSTDLNFTTINYPPYAIFRSKTAFSTRQTALIEVNGIGDELVLPLSPNNARLSRIADHPPRAFRLYQSNSSILMAGSSISSGSLSSHPIPVFGYTDKTLYFMANQDGSLLIEILTQTNNWITYDTDTISANTLWWYKMTGDAVLARLTFTPTTYPCTITEAEAILNG